MKDRHSSTTSKSTGSESGSRASSSEPERITHVLQTSVNASMPRKRPRQARAKETVSAIVQAAAEVIADLGYARATTNKIAARAGVSIGSLYQYFPNKEAILVSLLEQHMLEIKSVIDEAMVKLENPDHDFAEALKSLFNGLVELHNVNPKLIKVLSEEVPYPPAIRDLHQGEHLSYAKRTEMILRRRPEISVRDHAVASHILVEASSALSRWLVHEAPADLDKRSFIDEAVAMLSSYVLDGEA